MKIFLQKDFNTNKKGSIINSRADKPGQLTGGHREPVLILLTLHHLPLRYQFL